MASNLTTLYHKVGANALIAFINYCQQNIEILKKREVELDLANKALDRMAFDNFTHKLASPFQLDPRDEAALVDLGP